jgi:hypothetical protein
MGQKPKTENASIPNDILIAVYEAQWADIQHSRDQDWELAKMILAGFLGLSGLSALKGAPLLILWFSFCFVILSIVGMLVTTRHNQLFREKMNAIRILEKEMAVDKLHLFKPRTSLLRYFKVQVVLIMMYLFSGILFLIFAITILQKGIN